MPSPKARTDAPSDEHRAADAIAPHLLAWFDRHGRRDLPWQSERTPYTAWVAEIMLQQTQVATVIPYFQRFIARFPDVAALAGAGADQVLAHWSGLGYYARARNLHRAAQIVVERFDGRVPGSVAALMTLPGIGRSTAGAIIALANDTRAPILDGNVKRVLARYHAVPGWPGETGVARELWALAERHTPSRRVGDYTQAIMDLGATVCTRARPRCADCPLRGSCVAHASGSQHRFPAPRPKRARPRREAAVLVVRNPERCVLLEKRPSRGVWGGLYSLPELADGDDARQWCERRLGAPVLAERPLASIAHAFTHFDLDLHPLLVELAAPPGALMDRADLVWYNPAQAPGVGIAAPIGKLLRALPQAQEG